MNPVSLWWATSGYRGRRPAIVACLLVAATVPITILVMHARGHSPSATPAEFIIVATATGNEPVPVLPADIMHELSSAGDRSNRAVAYVVSPSGGQADVVSLTPRLADGRVDYGPTRPSVLNANVGAVQRAVEQEIANGPFDLLTAITDAVRAAPSPATLIVVSSGVSTFGGFDLRQVGWDASPRSVAAELRARGLLPRLTGYHLVFVGLGLVSGHQPDLPLPQQTVLIHYWLAICRAARADSCGIDESIRRDPPSRSAFPVPVVPVPAVTSVRGPGGTTVARLPDSLLFSLSSARLLPYADTVLRPLVLRARRHHLLVSIIGHASPDGGTDSYNLTLSSLRARSVRNRMVHLGLPPDQITQVAGVGTAGRGPNACLVAGRLDEALCAQLRFVVVILSPMKPDA